VLRIAEFDDALAGVSRRLGRRAVS
jgi:hypothetical protein